jgi:hypothetical protein
MPLTSRPLPAPRKRPTHEAVWKTYLDYVKSRTDGVIFGKAVLSPTGEVSQFHLEYLQISMERARFVNETIIVEFWRERAPRTFREILDNVQKEVWGDPRRPVTMQRYIVTMTHLLDLYRKKIEDFIAIDEKRVDALNQKYKKNQKLIVSKSARTTFYERTRGGPSLLLQLGAHLLLVSAHLAECRKVLKDRAAGKAVNPPPLPPFMRYDLNEQPF